MLFRYTLLLFLFEYRAATLLIHTHFPGPTAASITQFEIDGDVISLDGRDVPIRTESETDNHGRIRVRIRRSTSSAPESALSSSIGITPRPSNLSNADIFSVNTPLQLHEFHGTVADAGSGHDIVFGHGDLGFGYPSTSPRLSGYASSDAYSLQPTPRPSNFNEMETTTTTSTPVWARSPISGGRIYRQSPIAFPGTKVVCESPTGKCQGGERQGGKDITGSMSGTYMWCYLYCNL